MRLLRAPFGHVLVAIRENEQRARFQGYGFSQILAGEDLEPEEQKEFRELIHSNAEKLLLIIDDVLSISMIESNQLVLNDSTFDLNYFLQDCLHTSKVNCKNEDIEFKLLHPYEFKNLQIQSDKLRLGQILTNP